MGVKDLWSILAPVCDRKPLFELQGQTLAIDLSGWVVDSQMVTDNSTQPKMYLRNLFFRTANLLSQDIRPVFVLEGIAPASKEKTIQRRLEVRRLKDTGTSTNARKGENVRGRGQFNRVLKQCEEMLNYMGLKCVRGPGEAEETCAWLNQDGLVDGCISQDNDCFLYGARVVYRNFNTGRSGASNGSVDGYRMEKIEKVLNLNRKKMIALALICGCDYNNEGINGIGKEAVLKLFELVPDEDILDRIQRWRTNGQEFERMEAEMEDPNTCGRCGHRGNVRLHAKNGCLQCGLSVNCNDEEYKMKRKLIKNELAIRKKAIQDENFPSREIIEEYLVRKGSIPSRLELKWKQPKLVEFTRFMERHLGWESKYSLDKFIPLMTRWQLLNLPEIAARENVDFIEYRGNLPIAGLVYPVRVKKERNIKSVACYELEWCDAEGFFKEFERDADKSIDSDDDDLIREGKLPSTVEPRSLVRVCYPKLVEMFEEGKSSGNKSRGKPATSKKTYEKVSVTTGKTSNKREGKRVEPRVECGKRINDYFRKPIEVSVNPKTPTGSPMNKRPKIPAASRARGEGSRMDRTLEDIFESLTVEDFASEGESDFDTSEIIEKICTERTIADANSRTPSISIVRENENEREQMIRKNDNHEETTRSPVDDLNNGDVPDHENNDSFDEFDRAISNYVPLSQRVDSKFKTNNE